MSLDKNQTLSIFGSSILLLKLIKSTSKFNKYSLPVSMWQRGKRGTNRLHREGEEDVCSSGDEDLVVFPGRMLLTEAQEIEALKYVEDHALMWDRKESDFKDVRKKLAHWTTLGKKFGCTPEQIRFWYRNLRSAYAKLLKQVDLGCDAELFTFRNAFIWTHASFLFRSLWNKKGVGELPSSDDTHQPAT